MTEEERFFHELDVDYSYHLARKMEEFKTNPELGYRTAGSQAEFETGEFLVREMKAIGLSQVEKDPIKVDAWTFKRAVLEYTDETGERKTFQLGAYQTNFSTQGFREFSLIDVGKGTKEDYQNLEAEGKLVLADINQRDEWWINFPVYQAKLKGAAALLAVQEGGYGEIDENALNAQDIAGPADAPAFSISRADASLLKKALKASPSGEIKVRLNAETAVVKDQTSYNITGRIPGREKDSMILLSAHYDSYFSGFQDDNCAVAMMLGIARALILSGYRPQKTLVFCAMAAEEWGISDSKYDWSTGAYQQVFSVHPDWPGKVVADLNFELPAHAHSRKDAIRSTWEYSTFLKEFIQGIKVDQEAYPEGITVLCPIETWSDDFSIAISGIPSMVNDFAAGSFMETHYHSQFDNQEYYHEAVYRFHHQLYGSLVMAFDRLAAAPLDFSALFRGMADSLKQGIGEKLGITEEKGELTPWEIEEREWEKKVSVLEVQLREAVKTAEERGAELYQRVWTLNQQHEAALKNGQEETAASLRSQAIPLEKEMLFWFKKAQEYFVRLDWHDGVLFPQEGVASNLLYLKKAQRALEKADPSAALECLYQIDNNRYAFLFEEEVFRYFTDYVFNQPKERLAWGYGRIRRHANLFHLVERLKEMEEQGAEEFSKEENRLRAVEADQRTCYREDLLYMLQAVEKMSAALEKCLTGE